MDELLKSNPIAVKQLKANDLVNGIVVEVSKDQILVDIGSKSEGIVPKEEFTESHELEKSLKIYVLISNFFKIIFFIILSLVFIFSFKLNEQIIWLALAIGWAVILLLLDTKVHSSQTKLAILDQQEAIVEREWSAIGLEISFLHAILEMEASMKNADSSLKNLQNISSAQAERKRTLSHYDYQIRNEILVNIQSEKNWWSKIDVISNRWFNLK